jgi:hypothetical protein
MYRYISVLSVYRASETLAVSVGRHPPLARFIVDTKFLFAQYHNDMLYQINTSVTCGGLANHKVALAAGSLL